jgi:hypothetical protein
MLSLLKKRRKQKKLQKFLVYLNRLLQKRYGKSRYYTQGQVERTIEQEKLDKRFLWHGFQCFVDPVIAGQVIRADHPINMDEVLSDIGEAFSLDTNETSTDMIEKSVQGVIDDWQLSGLDYGFDGDFDAGSDAGFDGGGFDGGGGDGGGE